jgi:hypothetical protein
MRPAYFRAFSARAHGSRGAGSGWHERCIEQRQFPLFGAAVNSDCSTCTGIAPALRGDAMSGAARNLPARLENGGGALRGILVTLVGGLLVLVGLIGLFLPAPGVALIVLGLSVLSTRFEAPRRWLDSVQRGVTKLRSLRR